MLAGSAGAAWAAPITFSSTNGVLSASATFSTVGNDLKVTMTNTSAFDVMVPGDVLTAVFFDVIGSSLAGLSPDSAILGPGSVVLFGGSDPGNVVGGEWAYGAGLSGAPHGAAYGISSSGLDLFGSSNFPGNNLQGPAGVDGIQYGITSAGDDPASGNAAVTGNNALIKNQVTFMLSGLPAGFNPASQITNVSFQYGTSLSEPNVPEPATCAWLLAVGLFTTRKRRNLNAIDCRTGWMAVSCPNV
jgi:hypothetical protein